MNFGKMLLAQLMEFVPRTSFARIVACRGGDSPRAKRGMNSHRVYSMKVDRNTGIICDQRIVLDGFYISQDYPVQLRRIRFKEPETGKTLVFLTNKTVLPALTKPRCTKAAGKSSCFSSGSSNICVSNVSSATARAQ